MFIRNIWESLKKVFVTSVADDQDKGLVQGTHRRYIIIYDKKSYALEKIIQMFREHRYSRYEVKLNSVEGVIYNDSFSYYLVRNNIQDVYKSCTGLRVDDYIDLGHDPISDEIRHFITSRCINRRK